MDILYFVLAKMGGDVCFMLIICKSCTTLHNVDAVQSTAEPICVCSGNTVMIMISVSHQPVNQGYERWAGLVSYQTYCLMVVVGCEDNNGPYFQTFSHFPLSNVLNVRNKKIHRWFMKYVQTTDLFLPTWKSLLIRIVLKLNMCSRCSVITHNEMCLKKRQMMVFQSVRHRNISASIEWIAMKFCTDNYGLQRMNAMD